MAATGALARSSAPAVVAGVAPAIYRPPYGIFSPAGLPGQSGYETYGGEVDASREPQVAKTSLSKMQGDKALDEDAGFIGLGVFWLATKLPNEWRVNWTSSARRGTSWCCTPSVTS